MMYNSCSSNPPRTPERRHRWWAPLVAAALLAATAAAAQPLRQVLVEFRIEPGSTLDQARLTTPGVAGAAEAELARIAHAKFLYLDWTPAAQAADGDSPRWVLLLADGPRGACDPPSVRARFRAERGGVVAWTYPELELTELCDLSAPEITTEQLLARVRTLTELVFQDADAMKALEEQFLSEIVLAKVLAPDPAVERLYLPLEGLRAKVESEIEVRFENRLDRRLFAHPGDVEPGRTQLLVDRFACAGIDFSPPAPNALPAAWPLRLLDLLGACRDPWVYMKVYRPNPAAVQSGVVTTLAGGGAP